MTSQVAPIPTTGPLRFVELEAVSCWSTTYCVAVGSTGEDVLSETLVRSGVWVPDDLGQQPKAASDSEAALGDVVCTAYATCLALGGVEYDFADDEAQKSHGLYAIGRPR